MVLLDLLGRRMTMRVLWELSRAGARMTFRSLQTEADTNPAVLNQRLKELRAAGLVDHDDDGYGLTARGSELVGLMLPLHGWAETWAQENSMETLRAAAPLPRVRRP